MIRLCTYQVCMSGDCDNEVPEGNTFCEKHENVKCCYCEEKAVRECHRYNGSFPCGYPLCDECECGHR